MVILILLLPKKPFYKIIVLWKANLYMINAEKIYGLEIGNWRASKKRIITLNNMREP
jgi:hypothetical protein